MIKTTECSKMEGGGVVEKYSGIQSFIHYIRSGLQNIP